tara:strand:- start:221 stop:1894 length:1674 start_codon:yes stop_codon:yes gene_type:complete
MILYGLLLVKYFLIYLYFYFVGRGTVLIINYKFFKIKKIPKNLLLTKSSIIFPVLGMAVVGNVLIFLNYFFKLNSLVVASILIFLISSNLINLQKRININIENLISFILFPSILIFSTFDIPFNYDAGYYHLLHQAWLRDSNLIIGMVNIFWPFGMSSIYEYLSAILWFDKSFVLLHFLNLIFVQILYQFLFFQSLKSKFNSLKFVSIFILIYSILDNFGFEGGRNGFLYIQGVGKQDTAVGVLFFLLSIYMITAIKNKEINDLDFILCSLLVLFIYEIKVSSLMIFPLFIAYLFMMIKNKLTLSKTINYLSPALFFGTLWFLKSILTTGCLVFPVNITCFESFDWYVKNSTADYEGITKFASYNYEIGTSFAEWIEFTSSFEYRKSIFLNFIISLFLIYIIKSIFFNKKKNPISFNTFVVSYLILNFLYLLFYGPIPRYAIGFCLLTVSILGFFVDSSKFNIDKKLIYFLTIFSIVFIVRVNSYYSFLDFKTFQLFDPRTNQEIYIDIGFSSFNDNWVIPNEGDQCWANLKCSMAKADIIIEDGFFKTAYRNVNSS